LLGAFNFNKHGARWKLGTKWHKINLQINYHKITKQNGSNKVIDFNDKNNHKIVSCTMENIVQWVMLKCVLCIVIQFFCIIMQKKKLMLKKLKCTSSTK
jgi:hypothetical protein